MKVDYIELHRGNGELIRLDFKTNLHEVYNEEFDIPAIKLIKLSNGIRSGLKIYSDNSKHEIIKQSKRFYRYKNGLIKLFRFSILEELRKWERLDDFKYMLLSKSDEKHKLNFNIPLKLKSILKYHDGFIRCVCINLEQMSDEDKMLNNLICEDGTIINIAKLSKEFNLLLDYNKASNNREYIMEYNCIDDTLFILDNNSFYITYLPDNVIEVDTVFSDYVYDRTYEIDEKIVLDLFYTRLCIMTNTFGLV